MGKIKKKGEAGAAKNYIHRNQALKKLQVSLSDFRRLCILKGIYPREPKSRKKASGTGNNAPRTYYYTKDVQYLLHEPILVKFREHRAFAKKLRRFLAKREYAAAESLETTKPIYRLDHIIKERYPAFTDALRDLDDALCLVFLFANMPSSRYVDRTVIERCQLLSTQFMEYVSKAKALRKVFLSIKGIYYQAEIQGQTITWIVPYQFSQTIPADVDFRIMLTFLEFYRELLGFVNFKLLHDFSMAQEANATIDDFSAINKSEDKMVEEKTCTPTLFADYCFHISREVPMVHFSFMCTAFSGQISTAPQDPKVTHIIVDRPLKAEQLLPGKIYVQPQWVVDCLNQQKILPHAPYGVNKICPPHLSPFVVYDHKTYQPPEATTAMPQSSMTVSEAESESEADLDDEEEEDLDGEDDDNDEEEEEEEDVEEEVVTQGERLQDVPQDAAAALAEQKKLAQSMMSKKNLKLYKKMQHSNRRKDAEVNKLKRRREALDEAAQQKKQRKTGSSKKGTAK